MTLHVLIADDHRLFGELLSALLSTIDTGAKIDFVPSFPSARAAVEANSGYDLILLDLAMPGMLGLSGVEQMVRRCPGTPVAVVSGTMRQSDMRGALKAGARGVLPKTLGGDEFRAALGKILEGGIYEPPALAGETVLAGPEAAGRNQLTQREREVFEALVGGRSNAEIASLLGIREVTVKIHLQSVYRKLGAKNRSDAVRIGMIEAGRRAA